MNNFGPPQSSACSASTSFLGYNMYQDLPDGGMLATAIVFTLLTAAVIVAIAAVAGYCCRGEAKRAQPAGLAVLASPQAAAGAYPSYPYLYAPALGPLALAAPASASGTAASYAQAAAPRSQPLAPSAAVASHV